MPYIITGNTLWSIYYRIYNINSITESFTTCIPLSRFLNLIGCLTSTPQIAEEFSNISKVRNLLSDFGKLRERSGDSRLPERQSTHFNTYFSTVMGMGKGYYIVFLNAIYSFFFLPCFWFFYCRSVLFHVKNNGMTKIDSKTLNIFRGFGHKKQRNKKISLSS